MTTPIRAILATDSSGIIGLNGTLPWRYRADMQRFKQVTQGGVLIMGRKTWESIPKPKSGGEKLPGRCVIVLTKSEHWSSNELEASTLEEALCMAHQIVEDCDEMHSIWIAGGAQVYEEAIAKRMLDEIDITIVPRVTVPDGAEVTRLDWWSKGGGYYQSESDRPEGFAEEGLKHWLYKREARWA